MEQGRALPPPAAVQAPAAAPMCEGLSATWAEWPCVAGTEAASGPSFLSKGALLSFPEDHTFQEQLAPGGGIIQEENTQKEAQGPAPGPGLLMPLLVTLGTGVSLPTSEVTRGPMTVILMASGSVTTQKEGFSLPAQFTACSSILSYEVHR